MMPAPGRPRPPAHRVLRAGLAGARPVVPPPARARGHRPLRRLVRLGDDPPARLDPVQRPGGRRGRAARATSLAGSSPRLADASGMTRSGRRGAGLDLPTYAAATGRRGARPRLRPTPGKHALGGREIDAARSVRRVVNLLDDRDVLTVGALASRRKGAPAWSPGACSRRSPPRRARPSCASLRWSLPRAGRPTSRGSSRTPRAVPRRGRCAPRGRAGSGRSTRAGWRAGGGCRGAYRLREGFAAAARAVRRTARHAGG